VVDPIPVKAAMAHMGLAEACAMPLFAPKAEAKRGIRGVLESL